MMNNVYVDNMVGLYIVFYSVTPFACLSFVHQFEAVGITFVSLLFYTHFVALNFDVYH